MTNPAQSGDRSRRADGDLGATTPMAQPSLARTLRRMRRDAGMRPLGLALWAHTNAFTLARIELGISSADEPTLRALALVLADWAPALGDADQVTERLVGAAASRSGPGRMPSAPKSRSVVGRRRSRVISWLDGSPRRG